MVEVLLFRNFMLCEYICLGIEVEALILIYLLDVHICMREKLEDKKLF